MEIKDLIKNYSLIRQDIFFNQKYNVRKQSEESNYLKINLLI